LTEHYHVLSAVGFTIPLISVKFDNYEDSLEAYVKLSTGFFSHQFKGGDLAIENARASTMGGIGSLTGGQNLAIVWLRCEGKCNSGTWN
jgi:hypothetical protein